MRNDPLAPPRGVKVTMPFVIAAATAATFLSAGSVAVTRDAGGGALIKPRTPVAAAKPISIEARIPRNVVAFARVAVNPNGEDRAALERILRNVAEAERSSALKQLDEIVSDALPFSFDLGEARADLGEQMAFVFHVVDRAPQVVAIIETKDARKAKAAIENALGRGQVTVSDGDVLYAGTPRAISRVRAAAKLNSMATHKTYLRELGALGGSGLAVGWFDGSRLTGVKDSDLGMFKFGDMIPGGTPMDLRDSSAVGAAYIRGSDVVFEMRQRGDDPWFPSTSNPLRLLGNGPSDAAVAGSMADPAAYIRKVMASMMGEASGGLPPGVNLEEDLFSWLGNEVAFFMLPGDRGFAASVAIKNDRAFDRAFGKLKMFAGALGSIDGDEQGFTMEAGGRSVAMRRGTGSVSFAVAEDLTTASKLADEMSSGTGASLSKDPTYRAMFGAGKATMRFFVSGSQLGMFTGESGFWRAVHAIGYEMRIEGELSLSRVVVSFDR